MDALARQVVVVSGAEAPLGRGIALAFAATGCRLALLGHVDAAALASIETRAGRPVSVVETDFSSRDDVEDAFEAIDRALHHVDVVVHAALDPVASVPRPFIDIDDVHFEAVWEATMDATLWVLQSAHRRLANRARARGRVIVVIPTIGMSGAPGLAALAAAAEGQRLLAKSAARQWGPDGIVVNCLAVAPEHLTAPPGPAGAAAPAAGAAGAPAGAAGVPAGGVGPDNRSLAPAALGGPGDPVTDIGQVAVGLARGEMAFVTGATVCADGGVWMAP